MAFIVEFEPIGRRGECADDNTLLDAARDLGVDLASVCGGSGSCGRCKVQLVRGRLSALHANERDLLTDEELAAGYRLACDAFPLSDCMIHVPAESLTAPQRTQVEGLDVPVAPQPAVKGYMVQVTPPDLGDLAGDDIRLRTSLAAQHGVVVKEIAFETMQVASTEVRRLGWNVNLAVRGSEVVSVGAPATRWLGLAVDIGTTKIAAYLVDLESGRTVASKGAMNPQIAYGEDVIVRLSEASEGDAEAAKLQGLLVDGLNELATSLCGEVGATPAQIVDAVAVGNTAIHHLFLRLPVTQLAQAPYVPAVSAAVDVRASQLGLRFGPGASIHLLPNIAGFVGADHVAMLLATGLADVDDTVMALDIGTNTEICLAHKGILTSLSCASGPAFEGAHIKYGMRAAPGAIERVLITGDQVECKTIGDEPAVGICGSGILDALAQLRKSGTIDRTGRMRENRRTRVTEGVLEYILVDGADRNGRPPITISQRDVRELQLAKGAIYCGVTTLLQVSGCKEEDLDRVIIAGAFGTYIDVRSAITIGMLPNLPLGRFTQVGNAAGTGARMALISQAQRDHAAALAARVRYVELASAPGFAQLFARSMYLPETAT